MSHGHLNERGYTMSKGSKSKLMRRCMMIMLCILVLGFGTTAFRLTQLTLYQGQELQQLASEQQLVDTAISARRGTIYDTNGKILAQSATVWKVVLSPNDFKNDNDRTIVSKGLSEILGIDQEDIFEKSKENSYYSVVKRQIESDERDKILKFIEKIEDENDITGVIDLLEDYKRYYPYNDFASSLIGFTGSDDQGLAGLEYQYNEELTGTPGRLVTAKNGKIELPFNYEQKVDAVDGNSLVLTIDETIQHIMEKYLKQGNVENKVHNRSVAVMMDVDTGAILGLAVEGGYDLNDPFTVSDKIAAAEISKLVGKKKEEAESEALSAQWKNKAVSDTYYPGSVFKIITASMALEENKVNDESRFTCTGSYTPVQGAAPINCHNTLGHGTQTFAQAICNSCNPAFMMIGASIGKEKFAEYFQAFGYSAPTGIDLPGEATGLFFNNITDLDLAIASFGQGISVTPIQMVTAISAVANGGDLLQPYVVKQIVDSNGNVVKSTDRIVKRQVVSKETCKKISEILEMNATEGSAKNGYVAGYRVAGKTGTSEKKYDVNDDGIDDYIASFCGFAPADDPKVCLLVYFDAPLGNNYYGSAVAAPVFAQIMNEVMPYLEVSAQYTDEEIKQMDTTANSYLGLSVEEAEQQVKSDGYTCVVKGDGDKVAAQLPAASTRIPQGGTVVLYTSLDEVSNSEVEVPDFSGLSLAEANMVAASYNLNISVVGVSGTSDGVVLLQSEAAGDTVSAGTVITLTFTTSSNYGNNAVM